MLRSSVSNNYSKQKHPTIRRISIPLAIAFLVQLNAMENTLTSMEKTFKFFFIRNSRPISCVLKIEDAEGYNIINQIHSEENLGFFKMSKHRIEKCHLWYQSELHNDPDPYYVLLQGKKTAYIGLNMHDKKHSNIKFPLQVTVHAFITRPNRQPLKDTIFFEFTLDQGCDRKEIVITTIKTKNRIGNVEPIPPAFGAKLKSGNEKTRTLGYHGQKLQQITATETKKESSCLIQ